MTAKFLPLLFSILLCFIFCTFVYLLYDDEPSIPFKIENSAEKGPDSWPSEWIWLQRTFPYGKADNDAYTKAIQSAHSLKKSSRAVTVPWKFVGPTNIGGRIVDIEFDPINPAIVYAAAATGGIFKSSDQGLTWKAIFDDQVVLSMGDLAIDPVNTEIIYAGTGEANGGHNNFPGGGIYKSYDGGQNWIYSGLEDTRSIGRILVNPDNPEQIFVAAVGSYFGPDLYRGVFKSEDGGNNWSYSLFVSDSTGAIDLVMDPKNPSFLLAAMWERVRRPIFNNNTHLSGKSSGIYRSFDGGDTWEALGAEHGLPDTRFEQVGRIGLALYPQNADTVYALYNDGLSITGLYLSADRGDHWQLVDADNKLIEGSSGFSWYFGQVRVHPSNADIVYVLDVAFMRSSNAGNNFPLFIKNNSFDLHVDHHALAFHPNNPQYIIDGNDGGINISEDGGQSWIKAESLPVTQFYEIGLDPQNPDRYFGGTQDNGTIGTWDGQQDTWEGILGGDGFYVIVDPENSNLIYAESQFGNLYKIQDNNYRFLPNSQMMADKRNWSTPFAMSPDNNQTLYYGTNKIYRTLDGGSVWTDISPDLTRNFPDSRIGTVTTIAIAPSNTNYIYVGTDDGFIWISQDYGATWTNVTGDLLPFRWVTRVVVDPIEEKTVYTTFSGLKWKEAQAHVFRSMDAGITWENISGNLPDAPVNAFAIDPQNTQTLFCGTDVGVFVSFDLGKNWSSLGLNLPVVVVNDMKIHDSSYKLFVGTHGRSMYSMDLAELSDLQISEKEISPIEDFLLTHNYPNPFNSSTTIEIDIYKPAHLQLVIHDALGREVYQNSFENAHRGKHRIKWQGVNTHGTAVSSGIYFYSIILDGKNLTQTTNKMLLLR